MKREDITKLFPEASDEQISALLDINSADIGKAKKTGDDYKSQLEEVQEKLKTFEGVDVNELNGKIADLQKELEDKEAEHQKQLADRDFFDELNGAIKTAGGRSEKAITALLDVEALKASKNRAADIKAAIENCQKENTYLFGDKEPINNPVAPTGGSAGGTNPLAAMRAAMGLPVGNEK
ncbi:MAG: phage scaffolding protein [Lachnospiraceae bacterium]